MTPCAAAIGATAARKSTRRACAVACVSPARDRALLRRAVDEHLAAELGAQADEARHDLERARAHGGVGGRERQARRLDEQPVQAGDDQAARLDHAAQAPRFGGVDPLGRLGERERRDLEAVVAEPGGELALLGERHRAEHFVA